ncbi:alanine racemase [Fodinibius salsisoli]|uniref:Alanine racemase n=1 Tax=Fodinibius salsisoli TaxID=2820877 RepID=A0ABT3PR45_9BACT|nr:alanine racemase [Fodinibius salsisoli]MCW9708306.1 alanine racemase [Fodinibius salsisoli]
MIQITEPTLLLNEDICRANIQRMVEKAQHHSLQFKPHMKTHQSADIGEWLREAGVEAITVSSVTMASFFAQQGWSDITIAFPCNLREVEAINQLAEEVDLTLLVNAPETAQRLQKELASPVSVYIELDTGSERTGLPTTNITGIEKLIAIFEDSDVLQWKGFYSHPGHSYSARSVEDIRRIHQSVLDRINTLKSALNMNADVYEICIGDTPCCSKGTDFSGIDAISPGNFVFYDLMQAQIGSCASSDIATAVACPIVDRYPDRRQIAIYGGAIHFSKESIEMDGIAHYGLVAKPADQGWSKLDKGTYLAGLSQEHGIVQCSPASFEQFQIGDVVTVLPVHSCLTAQLLGEYQLPSGQKISQF